MAFMTDEMVVLVAYAPGDKSEHTFRKLERSFAKRGLQAAAASGSLAAFRQHLERGQCAALLISDAFLRSKDCMAELLEAETRPDLRQRIFPILLPDARLEKAVERLLYINDWDRQIQALKRAGGDNAAELEQAGAIRASFGRLPTLLKELQARTLFQQAEDNFYRLALVVIERSAGSPLARP